ncbi:MAG: HNH endonuclease [Desulfuromonadaceae bacterium]
MKKEIKDRLIKNYDNKCAGCGAEGVNLEVCHIVPQIHGGSDDEDNLTLLCSLCNYRFDSIRFTEAEFNNYLSLLIENSEKYKEVRQEERLARDKPFRADITAKSKDDKTWLIECKNTSSFTPERLMQAANQIDNYRTVTKFDNYVLAFPGLLSEEQRNQLKSRGIVAWDLNNIANTFKNEIAKTRHPIFKNMFAAFTSRSSKSPEEAFIDKLRRCDKGIRFWSEYQKLIGQILECLFCPPLEPPISELPDFNGVNRRDLILPNYSDNGFWCFIREKYLADYIVVDPKNHSKPVSKKEILQIANYLKPHGAGMFAIIVTRIGADKGAMITIREQWAANQKMIVIINDGDIEAMLLAKSASGDPSKIIGQKIEQFRLSM